MSEPTNGNVLRYRLDRVEHRVKGAEQAAKWIAEKGAKHNEQLLVHDEQFREFDRRLAAVEEDVKDLPAVRAELKGVKESVQAARTAGWGIVVALIGLAATILLQGGVS